MMANKMVYLRWSRQFSTLTNTMVISARRLTTHIPDDYELLERIKGNPQSFGELFTLYYKPIFGYILRRTGQVDDSADIAAETFYKALKHIDHFQYRGISLKVWLYRIATNEVNLYFRSKEKHRSLFDRFDSSDQSHLRAALVEDRQDLDSEIEKHDQYLLVLEAMKTLPIKYQEVLSLRFFEGKENSEIALILDINEGTLRSRISRGLDKLRAICNKMNTKALLK